jgi:hypothetical protein
VPARSSIRNSPEAVAVCPMMTKRRMALPSFRSRGAESTRRVSPSFGGLLAVSSRPAHTARI